ncbi:TrbI/VirB10 family protein [Granulicella tundricola]|uniref:Conjugation TrbI family protein n=1 Tax=Granulicella tundricola (strain ATCC BAA-1859 / DSM 23138 / MP5ACTX9) TaxID=1198114 RepID=E8X1G3_GRATM|nr:TrbI/VirB10 family protein [Granulicella tundricola]ADW70198.1 conjugation TrbI family protein [Granulicella tundricola MP5ACTX9]
MMEPNETKSVATVPEQPEAKTPLRKSMPVVVALVVIVGLIGIANVSSLMSGNKKVAPQSALTMSPTTPNAQQVSSFETQQQNQAKHDAEELQRQQALAKAMQELQQEQSVPGPESAGTPPMTAAQREQIYGSSPNAPQQTSNMSEAQAEAKQKRLAVQKQAQDAQNSDTVAIDFSHEGASPLTAVKAAGLQATDKESGEEIAGKPQSKEAASTAPAKSDPMSSYSFDQYDGELYRIFEGTVLEGVVTNHIDGGLSGPILVMLTTDYYSHDHQQLLMPQGTRLIGSVQAVGNAQQRKMFVTFHRAVCPDGFSLDFDKYVGLDQIGTTGLATRVDHGYLMAFGAAAAIGGLGGLAQIGNNASILTPSAQIREGISEQSAAEGEQVLNHFLNRLPVITLKEGSRARVYIGRDILIPSYAEHRVNPTL